MIDFLTSARGTALLAELAEADLSDTLRLLTQLRKTYTPEEASAALSLAQARQKAVEKFGADAVRLYFTEEALQQASDPLVRRYRAQVAAGRTVLDLCCGIGADALAFAQMARQVIGVDIDPGRVAMARANAAVLGLTNVEFIAGDVREPQTLPQAEVVFFDPARRDSNARRIHDVARYIPPLATLDAYDAPVMAAKLAPGVDLPKESLEFISVNGDLKEAVLWRGLERPAATLLTADGAYHWPHEPDPLACPLSPPRGWLVEPDPAILRARLVQPLALALGGTLLDPTIAYITTDAPPGSPWVRAWQILDWMPFNLKKLRAYLRARDVGQVTVKKRGSPLSPEELIRKLKLQAGDSRRTVVLTQHDGQAIVVICAEYPYNKDKMLKPFGD